LEREFGERFATVHGSDPDATLDAEDLEEFLWQQPEIAAVSSHHLRYPKPVSRHAVYFDCCFLRDPVARLYSCYNHYRRGGVGSPYASWAQSLSAREFALRLIDVSPHVVSDVQTTQLANGGAFTRPADARDLERASAALRKMAIPGLVELFDESLVLAEYFLRPAFPELRLEYVPQNMGPSGRRAQPESREFWQGLWGEDLHGLLERMNEMDLELVRRAKREVLRRFERIPRADEKLADLRARCARLALGTQETAPRAFAAAADQGGGNSHARDYA
jgi:hypothetical protein